MAGYILTADSPLPTILKSVRFSYNAISIVLHITLTAQLICLQK